jgi:hypothetical protein
MTANRCGITLTLVKSPTSAIHAIQEKFVSELVAQKQTAGDVDFGRYGDQTWPG